MQGALKLQHGAEGEEEEEPENEHEEQNEIEEGKLDKYKKENKTVEKNNYEVIGTVKDTKVCKKKHTHTHTERERERENGGRR